MNAPTPPILIITDMVKAIFYRYVGHPDTINKTLTDGVEVLGQMREPFNVMNPRLTVRQSGNLQRFNYVHIPDFNRFYFVETVTQTDNDRVIVNLSVDVLKSYETEILDAMATLTESDNPNPHISNRQTVYNMQPNFEKVDFPNKGLLSGEGKIIMVTIKGQEG